MNRTKYRVFWNHENEERWLNEMVTQGWALVDMSGLRYIFAPCQPGAYIYRLELLEELPTHVKSYNYLSFLREAGVEVVDSHLRWIYLRRPAKDGPFDLYTDRESRIRHYGRITTLYGIVGIANLPIGITNLSAGLTHFSRYWGNLLAGLVSLTVAGLLLRGAGHYVWQRHLLKQSEDIEE